MLAEYEKLLQAKSMSERRQMFRELSSERKAAVWTHHLRTTLERHPEFNEEQRALIEGALALITPAMYERPRTAEPVPDIRDRAFALFGPLAPEIFGNLGPDPAQST